MTFSNCSAASPSSLPLLILTPKISTQQPDLATIPVTILGYVLTATTQEDSKEPSEARYFFSFYNSVDQEAGNLSVVLESILMFAVFISSVLCNGFIVICIFRYPDMRTVTNKFILNLAFADVLLVLSMPLVIYSKNGPFWPFGDLACKLVPYTQVVSGMALLWTIAFISLDRHSCIVLPPYRSKITTEQATAYSLLLWITSAALQIPIIFFFRELEVVETNSTICSVEFPHSKIYIYQLMVAIPLFLGYVVPMVVTIRNYTKIFLKMLATRGTWAASCVTVSNNNATECRKGRRQSEVSISDIFTPWNRKTSNIQLTGSSGRHGSLSKHEEVRVNKHIKVMRVVFLNLITVFFMWAPIITFTTLLFVDSNYNYFLSYNNFQHSILIAYLNTLVNPLIYGIFQDNFRGCLVQLFCNSTNDEGSDVVGTTPIIKRNFSFRMARKQSFATSSDTPQETV